MGTLEITSQNASVKLTHRRKYQRPWPMHTELVVVLKVVEDQQNNPITMYNSRQADVLDVHLSAVNM